MLDESLTRFDEFAGELKEEISMVSDQEEAETRHKEDLIQEEQFRRRMEKAVKIEQISYPKGKFIDKWATFYI